MTKKLEPGSHLISPRSGYFHHGIYVGNGRVIHYSGLANDSYAGPVEEVSISQFASGNGYLVKEHIRPKYRGAEVIRRARSRLGENAYSVFGNNCEHFCEWCVSGFHRSHQVDFVLHVLRMAGDAVSASTQGRHPSRSLGRARTDWKFLLAK